MIYTSSLHSEDIILQFTIASSLVQSRHIQSVTNTLHKVFLSSLMHHFPKCSDQHITYSGLPINKYVVNPSVNMQFPVHKTSGKFYYMVTPNIMSWFNMFIVPHL